MSSEWRFLAAVEPQILLGFLPWLSHGPKFHSVGAPLLGGCCLSRSGCGLTTANTPVTDSDGLDLKAEQASLLLVGPQHQPASLFGQT